MKAKQIAIVFILFIYFFSTTTQAQTDGWINLFDGKSLDGWKASEHPSTFSVGDSGIVVFGDRAHLFYNGSVNNHNFKNFEFKVKVLTKPEQIPDFLFIQFIRKPDGLRRDMKYR